MSRWLVAFAFTQIVEVPIYAYAFRRAVPDPKRLLLYAFAASALTHPIVWFVFPRVVRPYPLMLVCAEAFAVLAEAALFAALRLPRPLVAAFVANAASVALGFASRKMFGVP